MGRWRGGRGDRVAAKWPGKRCLLEGPCSRSWVTCDILHRCDVSHMMCCGGHINPGNHCPRPPCHQTEFQGREGGLSL